TGGTRRRRARAATAFVVAERARRLANRSSYCRIDILVLTHSRIDDFPLGIEHSDVGSGRCLERSYGRPICIPQERERHWMFVEMTPDSVLALIDRHSDHEKLNAIAVLLLRRFHARQQLGANGAPRRPELDNHGPLPNPLRQ